MASIKEQIEELDKQAKAIGFNLDDCYYAVNPLFFWSRLNDVVDQGSVPDCNHPEEAVYGARGRIKDRIVYVQSYVKEKIVVIHNRKTKKYLIAEMKI